VNTLLFSNTRDASAAFNGTGQGASTMQFACQLATALHVAKTTLMTDHQTAINAHCCWQCDWSTANVDLFGEELSWYRDDAIWQYRVIWYNV